MSGSRHTGVKSNSTFTSEIFLKDRTVIDHDQSYDRDVQLAQGIHALIGVENETKSRVRLGIEALYDQKNMPIIIEQSQEDRNDFTEED